MLLLLNIKPKPEQVYPVLHGNMPMQCDHSCCAQDDPDNSHFCMHILQQDKCKSLLHLNQRQQNEKSQLSDRYEGKTCKTSNTY